jgi:hypothetical protein
MFGAGGREAASCYRASRYKSLITIALSAG